MTIVPYESSYKEAFIRLNTECLTRFYWIEDFDQYSMDHIEDLIRKGAMAYFALDDFGEVLATCMAMPLSTNNNSVWEICKLAARNQYTGAGAGSAVLQAAINYAEKCGAKKEVLISCKNLKPAIHLYRKFGFCEVPYYKEFWKSEKVDIEMEHCIK